MPRTSLLSFAVLAFTWICLSHGEIYQVDKTNLQETITTNPLVIVEFFAPWCGACKKFAPEYELASQELKEGVLFTAFDAWDDSQKDIADQYNVASYPTIIIFQNGQPTEYSGDLTKEALVNTLKRKMRPAYVEITTPEQATQFWEGEEFAVLGWFDSLDSKECQQFIEVAQKLKEKHLFGLYLNPPEEFAVEMRVSKLPVISLVKRFDEGRVDVPPRYFYDLENLIDLHVFPLIEDIGKHNYKMYVEAEIPIAFVFIQPEETASGYNAANAKVKKALRQKFEKIAQGTRRRINFVFIDWTKYGDQAVKLGLSGKTVPSLAIEFPKEKKHYAFPESEDLLKADVSSWVEDYLTGKLAPTVITEEPDDNSVPIKVAGSNYHTFVHDRNRHVLIEYWAPWCGHCKAMAPIYKQLAEEYNEQSGIAIATMDATANDYDAKDSVSMFPTIRLYKLGEPTPIEYKGGKNIEELRAFVKEHTGLQPKIEAEPSEVPTKETHTRDEL